ncbi:MULTISPECIES: DUF3575 domain-containing protein [Flavobacteriaceae]|jgi:hypothetical protein|uniref:DUF3575 domain-containing protein n=2 Tax=Flavobacteriaceae TaxID=49546 RepID=A0ABN1JFW0_9FLAO|nr:MULTISPECIES: DUF3575 domain-containing protein [Meridianimaribacter]RYH75996.1 DUF3575 domain-containing protein [Flavobacteriaceae bacterium 144Ye]TBV28089.1 hypothetical protein DMZ43_03335 [Meridianimaribacter sp. CL38]TDY13791.1 uncharacterized protein DUF3575 [Meridianimaribacter flavus]
MKKTILHVALLLSVFAVNAQELTDEAPKKSEISTNLLDLVVAGTLNVNYERLFDKNQSLLISANFFDTYGYYDAGYIEKSNALSFKAAYLIYFSKEKEHAGFFFYPQLKVRTGEITVEEYYYYDYENETSIEEEYTYDVDGFSAGFGIGHKWMFSNKFTLTLYGDIARNLGNFDTDYLENIELRFGVNFGYRF